MTGSRLDVVTVDAVDTLAVAEFWCAVLYASIVENEDAARWLCLADATGRRLLGIQRTTAQSAAARPSGLLHLDLACEPGEFAGERLRILALGATETRPARDESYGAIANFRAPDGTLFDLCAYVG